MNFHKTNRDRSGTFVNMCQNDVHMLQKVEITGGVQS